MFELRRLESKRKKLVTSYGKQRSAYAAKQEQNPDEYNAILASEHLDLDAIDAEIEVFLSDRLTEEANELDVPLPERGYPPMRDENWYHDHPSGRACLTVQGRHVLRAGIDAEKARRFEAKTLWFTKIIIPFAGILIGIIGALTGLFAVLRHAK